MKFSSVRWILIAVGICFLLGIVVVLFFSVDGGGREATFSGGINGVLNGSLVELQVRSVRILYGVGDAVQVEGTTVANAGAGGLVEVGVVDPDGRLWDSGRMKLSGVAGNISAFSAIFRSVREDDSAGVYLIQAEFGGVKSNASFLVSTSSGLTAEVRSLKLQDAGGGGGDARIRRVGDMLLVAGSVANLAKISSDLSFIVELRNASGRLVESGYVGTTISAGRENVLTVGWPIKAEGSYTIYAYVQDNVQSRRIISNIATLTISVQN